MTKPKSLSNILWVTMTSIYLLLGSILAFLWINEELRHLQSQIKNIRTIYVNSQKEIIKTQVTEAVNYIYHKKSLAEKRVRKEVKTRTNEAWNTALYIYEQNKSDKPLTQIKKLVHDALYAISWDEGRGYYFAEDMDGTELINRNNPELEGKNIINLQDSKGTYLVKEIIAVAQSEKQEGFCSYYWNKPEYPDVLVPKISYVKYFKPFDWVIGNGKYIVDEEEKLKKEAIARVERVNFGTSGYIFAGTWDGISLSGPFAGENMLEFTDPNGVKVVQELIQAAKSGGGFVEYVTPKFKGRPPKPKISYAESIPEWKWYIGTGLHIDSIETVILEKKIKIKKDIGIMLFKGIGVLCIFFFISFFFVRFISKKMKKNLYLFTEFFKRSAHEALPIEEDKVYFSEFQSLAVSANRMSEERQKSEKALRKSEKKFREIFNKILDVYYETTLDGTIIEVSPSIEKYSQWKREELIGQSLYELYPNPLERDKLIEILLSKGKVRDYEVNFLDKDSSYHICSINTELIYDDKGNPKKLIGVLRDISKRKQAEAEKLSTQKIVAEQKKLALVGQISGKMAHDFNNVLSIIMGNTELALLDPMDEKLKNTLELIYEQTIRGKNLTKNLIAFAKDQEPKQDFFKISEKTDLVVNLMRKDLEGITVIKEDRPGVPDLLADPGMIEHALINLIQNSIHSISMVESPKITIRTYRLNNNICIEIEDNGCGIPKEHLESIYEPAFTLKGSNDHLRSYDTSIKGTGYGMSNVKKYIEQHNGNILVESEFGSWTKVTLSLPVVEKELTKEEKKEIRKSRLNPGKYILLLEDEHAISNVQYKILTQEPCNHKVDVANNGQVAIDLFDRNEYDFVSLDYVLPGNINGMDVYNHIREADKTIPILFISGNIEFLESIKELKQKDINIDHLSKPCRNKEYVDSINRLLKRKFATS
ncbi:MAG: cache domain-containing protein [Desulfobacteraceae bacterium]|nr:cache domain-containing protein [Desulfobacteraceae bacterium]